MTLEQLAEDAAARFATSHATFLADLRARGLPMTPETFEALWLRHMEPVAEALDRLTEASRDADPDEAANAIRVFTARARPFVTGEGRER